ncbi:hypothetical protein SpCBS45565_g06762 [Spizellomyces sp. 'palustris']|nr:hypothetical protein SpCBS45565_g06762 [Spizellomyces sp. 'palustris']
MWDALPTELKSHIIPYLTFPSLLAMHNVSRTLRALVRPQIAVYLHSVTATVLIDCGRSKPLPVQMVLMSQGSHGGSSTDANDTARVGSFLFEPAAAKILGPNHYQIWAGDTFYRVQGVTISCTGRGERAREYTVDLPLGYPAMSLSSSRAIFDVGVEGLWEFTYELNQFRHTSPDVEFRPWLLVGLKREDAIKHDTMTRFFVLRRIKIAWELLTMCEKGTLNDVLSKDKVTVRKVKGGDTPDETVISDPECRPN